MGMTMLAAAVLALGIDGSEKALQGTWVVAEGIARGRRRPTW